MESLIPAFVDALIAEIGYLGQSKPQQTVHTIFFGGGTPSLLTPEQLKGIMEALHQHFLIAADAEITLEANPNDVDAAYLAQLRQSGVNRLSLGVQTVNDNELRLFARRHSVDEIAAAVRAARQAGFDNINLDLIYGIPHQTLDTWNYTLDQVIRLQPSHLSLYALGLEEGTPMYDWVHQGRVAIPEDDLTADMYELATDVLAGAGYEQYEISNWSKPGRQCQHNLQYWLNLPYAGLGPGAHGFADGIRYSTVLSPYKYVELMSQPFNGSLEFPLTPAVDQQTRLQKEDEIAETLIMGLRLTAEGIRWSTFESRFGEDLRVLRRAVIDKYVAHQLLEADEQRVRLTRQGRLLSNTIFRDLI
jgi:oxygen-independent coproporphyrinogen-3 oxidase